MTAVLSKGYAGFVSVVRINIHRTLTCTHARTHAHTHTHTHIHTHTHTHAGPRAANLPPKSQSSRLNASSNAGIEELLAQVSLPLRILITLVFPN